MTSVGKIRAPGKHEQFARSANRTASPLSTRLRSDFLSSLTLFERDAHPNSNLSKRLGRNPAWPLERQPVRQQRRLATASHLSEEMAVYRAPHYPRPVAPRRNEK